MENDVFHHEFIGQTVVHPVGLAVLLTLGLALLVVPRRYAVWPIIIMACFIAPAQRIIFMGANFDFLRIMVVFGWVRLLLRGEFKGFVWKTLDIAMVFWALGAMATYVALRGTAESVVTQLGHNFDALGLYFMFRALVRDWDDLSRTVLGFIVCSVPVAICFSIEKSTGRNPFAFLGGVPAITMVREGRVRCQGAFAHPIMAGCFWASMVPLMAAGFWRKGAKLITLVGLGCSAFIIITCASSTPVMGVLIGMLGASLFPIRRYMRIVRWGLLFTAIGLHLAMQAPIWHLISRIDISGGSTGYFRFLLIDQTIQHVDEWWAVGVTDTGHWGPGLTDITNQFIYEAVNGGILRLVLFVVVLSLAFRDAGRLWRVAGQERWKVITAWALGSSLLIHVANFWAVSYFGQIMAVWYLHLAAIATLSVGKAQFRTQKIAVRRSEPAPLSRPPRPPRRTRVPEPAAG